MAKKIKVVKTCDTCEHGDLIGGGDLWCGKFSLLKEDYEFAPESDKCWQEED